MQGIPKMGNTSTDFASSMYGGSYVRLLDENDNIPTPNSDVNFEEHPIQNEEQPKKQKKRKVDGNRQDVDKIINALEKSDDRGPSVKDCVLILKRILNYKNPLYFVASKALCKRRENREFWMEMDNDEERLAWIESLQN